MADILQIAVMPDRERLWTLGDDLAVGFVVRAADVAWATTPSQVIDVYGLTALGAPFGSDLPAIDVLRFPVVPSMRVVNATGMSTQDTADSAPGEGFVQHPPFTGSGFAPVAAAHIVPMWWLEPTRVPAGAELWRLHADGSEELLSVYANVASGWHPSQPPQLAPSDTIGRFGTWRGARVMVDPLPDGKAVIASAAELEGLKRTDRGLFGGVVSADELSDLHALQLTGTWRGLQFQIVRTWRQDGQMFARIVYVGRDARAAEAVGLERTDVGVYEASVPTSQIENLEGVQLMTVSA